VAMMMNIAIRFAKIEPTPKTDRTRAGVLVSSRDRGFGPRPLYRPLGGGEPAAARANTQIMSEPCASDRTKYELRARPGEPEDQCERLLRPRPQLADQLLAARADEAPEDERDDDRVVELPGDRDEVRHEVERQG